MKFMTIRIAGMAAFVLLAASTMSSGALTTIMDQIGPDATSVQGQGYDASQVFEPTFSGFNIASVDNFSISGGPTTLAEVDAAVVGFNGFTGYSNVTGWQVAIYSSPTAAANSGTGLTGYVFNLLDAPGQVTLTTPFGTDADSALVQIPVTVTLGPGTYYIAVIADMAFSTGGQVGVYESTYAGTPSDFNAFQANPGGSFGLTDNIGQLDTNLAYRVLAQGATVPEPPSAAILAVGVVGAFSSAARRGCRRLSPAKFA